MAAVQINFNTKHLTKGDALPPYTGKPRVYNMRYCPYAQRTILALNAKKVDYEVVNINLFDKPEWLTSKSIFGKVPFVEVKEGETISESLVTVEYIDDIYPQRPLLPKDPLKKAHDKIIVESIGPIQTVVTKSIRAPDTISDADVAAYNKALGFVQDQLKSRGSKFLDESEPAFADYMIWPWFERILAYEDDERVRINRIKFEWLFEYITDMLKDPVISQYAVPKDIYLRVYEGYRTGTQPEYDILFQK